MQAHSSQKTHTCAVLRKCVSLCYLSDIGKPNIEDTVDHRLVDQVDPKGVLADLCEQRNGVLLKYPGDSSCLEVTAQEYAHKEQK